jgi:hypothetical protein
MTQQALELHAIKVEENSWSVRWELRIKGPETVVGSLFHNRATNYYTASVQSRFTGLQLGAYQATSREFALLWARGIIENEAQPTVESLDADIARCRDARYQDEMSDDFAYSNGKIAAWDEKIRRLERIKAGLVG